MDALNSLNAFEDLCAVEPTAYLLRIADDRARALLLAARQPISTNAILRVQSDPDFARQLEALAQAKKS